MSFGAQAYAQTLFEKNLQFGDRGADVQRLQEFLNTHGARVADSGPGSPGHETELFGLKTVQAVKLFQERYRSRILDPIGLRRGTGKFYSSTRNVANTMLQLSQPLQQTIQADQRMMDSGAVSIPNSKDGEQGYLIGGTVTGLSGSVVLSNNYGEELMIHPGDAANFAFSRKYAAGESYVVSTRPVVQGVQQCYTQHGTGQANEYSGKSISIQCVSDMMGNPFERGHAGGVVSYALGGVVSGLSGSVTLQSTAGDSLVMSSDGGFTFPTKINSGASYAVTVVAQPETQTCTVTQGSGLMRDGNVTNVSVSCVANTTVLSASINMLALSVTGITEYGVSGTPSSGSARIITITNSGGHAATNVAVVAPTWPSGTTHTTTCDGTLSAGSSCTITITPGATATSDGTDPCTSGTAPVPGVVQATADNASTVSTNIVVLGYGCVYQDGYVFALDDSTPITESVGGKVAALEDHEDTIVWGSNNADAASVSYDMIPGIGDTSTPSVAAPSFAEFETYFGSTYAGVQSLSSGSFRACQGNQDGRCNTENIVAFYDHYQTNYGVGGAPYTPVVAATPKSYYAAGVCDAYDSGAYQDWYLPAICEVTHDNVAMRPDTPGCGEQDNPTMQNIEQSLFLNSLGNLTAASHLWSSTQHMFFNPETYAWNGLMWFSSFPGGGDKSDLASVRCVRGFTEE